MKDYLVKKLVMKNRMSVLDEKRRIYEDTRDPGDIVRHQIDAFNRVWERCYETVPFYKQWRQTHKLPKRITSVRDLQGFPILTKRVIQDNQDIIFQNGLIKRYVSTGGTTGEPTRFPFSKRELTSTYANIYVGRSWHGVKPLDHMLLFWGHSHLFGSGARGAIRAARRRIYDYIVNIRRLDAYDMTAARLENYAEVFRQARNVKVIIGYTSCVYKLAKYIHDNRLEYAKKEGLKAVIVTAEIVTKSDIELLEQVFQAPIVIEYGMAETGVIAYSRGTPWNIAILWDVFIATADRDNIMIVTTLFDKVFPLINYQTDDIVDVKSEMSGSILEVSSIRGRKRDVLRMRSLNGSVLELSGILMVHVLKAYPHILAVQFEQLSEASVCIFVVADRQLDVNAVRDFFLKEMRRDHKHIDCSAIEIRQVAAIAKTVGGKDQMILEPAGLRE